MKKMMGTPTLVAWGEGARNEQSGTDRVEWAIESIYEHDLGHYTGARIRLPLDHRYVMKIFCEDNAIYGNTYYFDTFGAKEMKLAGGQENVQIATMNLGALYDANGNVRADVYYTKEGFCNIEIDFNSTSQYVIYFYKLD